MCCLVLLLTHPALFLCDHGSEVDRVLGTDHPELCVPSFATGKGCERTELAALLPNWVRLYQGQKQKVGAFSVHPRGTFCHPLRVAFRPCAHNEAGHHGRKPTSALPSCVLSLSSSPRSLFRAMKCLPPVSQWLPGILIGESYGLIAFPSGLAAIAAGSVCLLFKVLKWNERRRSFCLPNSQIQLLARTYSVF